MTARAVALDVLVRVEGGAYANLLLAAVLRDSDLDARDRAFVTELVYGTLRRQRTLDHLLASALDRPLAELEPPVRAALRLGADQLLVGVAPHAAVGETVAASPRRARPLVNAVLRKLAGTGPPWPLPGGDDPAAIGVRLSYPDWIVERMVADLGRADALAVLTAGNEAAPVTLRPFHGQVTPDALARELAELPEATVEPGALGTGAVVVRGIGDVGRLPAVVEGRATPQDEASQAVVTALDPEPGHAVLDACAAPGGKTTAAAERVGHAGVVVATDVHAARLRLVRLAAARLRLGNVRAAVADGRALPVRTRRFDRVLVDAPCTGLGVLRRRAEARWRIRSEAVAELAGLQRTLLREAAGALAPGGTLVYSVCTLTREETLGVDAWAAESLPELEALPPPGPPWRSWGRGALLLPHVAGTDGMFVLRLHRKSPAPGR
ncbi:MAG TPA: 16S rRNA (cytosine(967)-C(5))-methyltransferase RsmB [Acidimicrobiia bacterium]